MFENSQGNLFESTAETWTPSSADLPASPPALPASEKDHPTIAGSGLTICAWCLKSNPCGCSQRTLAECLASALTAYGSVNGLQYSLRISDTRSSRSCLVLQTSVRRTSESESGLWPTPTVHGNNNQAGTTEKAGDGLATAARKWPTPVCPNGGRRPKGGSMTLTGQTPEGKKRQVDLDFAVRHWATPTASYRDASPKMFRRGNPNLAAQASKWATPIARDYKSTKASDATHEKNARPLSEQVGQWAKAQTNTNGKRRASLTLNPRWELQLMGAIAEWLDIGVEKLSKLLEMRLSLRSRKSLPKPSTNMKGD